MPTPLTLTVITDTHYYSKKSGVGGKAYDAANAASQLLLGDTQEVLEAAFRQIKNDNRSDIVLLSGDTTSNGQIDAHNEFIEMLRDLKKSGKRVYVITATHDYQSEDWTWGYGGDERVPVPAALREQLFDMYREFGPDEAIAVHRQSMSYIVQLAEGYRLFALNDDSNLSGKSGFSDELFGWIAEQAEDAKKNGQFIIAMTHHPLIAPSPMYELIGKNDMMGDYKTRREQLADLGIQFILTGHTHVHDIDKHISPKGNTLYDIATASTVGYPAAIRTVVLNPDSSIVSTTTDLITEPVSLDLKGKSFQAYLADQMIGVVRDMIKAAGEDIDKFADMAVSISIKKKLTYKIGWLIKYPMKALNHLKIGTVGNWTRAETGLRKEDYSDIKDKSVIDFIIDMVLNLYGGKSLYSPEDKEYKIAVGLFNIIDSVLKALHVPFKKLVGVSDSVRDMLEPLLYNSGIPSYDAILPIMPYYSGNEAGSAPQPTASPSTVKESRKGPWIVAIAILLIILLLPVIIGIGLPVLLIAFIVNQIKYRKYLK